VLKVCTPILVATLLVAGTAQPAALPAPTTSPYVHDPVMIRQGDTYYLFGTGQGIDVHSSTDMKHWTQEPPAFARAPEWTFATVPGFAGHIWAPDVSEHNGTYYLYYAISLGGKITSAIGVATNKTLDRRSPDFSWVDQGMIVQSIPRRDLWNAIDPQLVIDEKDTPWLAFGSFWSGIKLVKLRSDLLRIAEPQEWRSIAKRERSVLRDDLDAEPAAIEAPFVFKHGQYYYLFVSWDFCCRGVKSNYKIVVGRSLSAIGPYVDKSGLDLAKGGGTLVLRGNQHWPGVGHNSAYSFDGKNYIVFHAYDATDDGKSKLKVLEMGFDADGWPTLDPHALD
jgi:arabinan endo-1,5-alpha-L-arabinosidase